MNLRDALKESGIYNYIENIRCEKKQRELLSKCSIEEYTRGEIFYYSPESEDRALMILEGRMNIRICVTEDTDYVVPWDNSYWLGISQALSAGNRELEINVMEDMQVLYFPLEELLKEDPAANVELWMRVGKMAMKKCLDIQKKTMERVSLSTESYFMRALAKNDYKYKGKSIQDISYELNISTRTLQRVIQGLVKRGYVKRDRSQKTISMTEPGKIQFQQDLVY